MPDKLVGLSGHEPRAGQPPSGWAQLELLHHLTHGERRRLRRGRESADGSVGA
ncbi:hypothetical protein ACK1X7_32770 [Streptomyces sp. CY1]|uniref:hypothetical protein n=1 Tax=Streptomyces sp. CY1 TaxID=3388313 RepID=UPI0039A055DA